MVVDGYGNRSAWMCCGLFMLMIVLLAVLSAACGAAESRSTLVLVRDGKPASTIVIANDATKSAQFAAYELQYHIEKITGAKLAVVTDDTDVAGTKILVGDSKAAAGMGLRGADFEPQEYLVGFRPNALVLIGRDGNNRHPVDYNNAGTFPDGFDDQGTCYATYDFLERFCGVRWYLPTELGLVCPSRKTLEITGKDVRRSPAIKYRWTTPIRGYASLWGDTVSSAQEQPLISDRDNALWNRRYRIGGEPYEANHSLEGYYERFLKAHPDWFAQGYEGVPPQLCYTNPEVIAQVVQDARDYFDGKGRQLRAVAQGDYFALVPMDGGGWCKCPRCREALTDGSSNYFFSFANKVAVEVKKSHPGKFIATLAYSSYIDVPTKVRLESNVTVMTCLDVRNAVTNPDRQKIVMKRLSDWVAESPKRPKYLWLYFCWPALNAGDQQFRCFPGFFAQQLVKDMDVFRSSGMRGIFFEPSYISPGRKSYLLDQLEWYITWKMADDPSLDGNKLIDEFFTLYYGSAAAPMKSVYNKIESIYCNSKNYPAGPPQLQTEEIAWKYLGNETRMAEFGKLMEQAKQAAQTDIEKQRVALFDEGIWRYMQAGRKEYLDHEALKGPTMRELSVPKIVDSAGDPSKVDWSKSVLMSDWRTLMGQPSPRKLEARVAHDEEFLYLRLQELIDTKTLRLSGDDIWYDDDWEMFFAKARSRPYHQMGINTKGFHLDFVNGDAGTGWDSGAKVVSDVTSGDRWIVLVAIPLNKLVEGGARPGDTVYMNLIRGAAEQQVDKSAFWVPTFGSYSEPSRFGAVTLDK